LPIESKEGEDICERKDIVGLFYQSIFIKKINCKKYCKYKILFDSICKLKVKREIVKHFEENLQH